MTFIAAFGAAFIFVFLKSFQQQNVVHRQYLWIMPTSMAMAFCEGYVVLQIATVFTIPLLVIIGLGSGLGCMVATYVHSRYIAHEHPSRSRQAR